MVEPALSLVQRMREFAVVVLTSPRESCLSRPAGRATVAAVERSSLPAPRLTVQGRPLDCTTSLTYAGAYQLTLSTVVPQLAVELHSSYLGHPGGETAVSHLRLRPGEQPATVAELQPGRSLPVREGRRLCLYDHLAVLRELVADEAGAQVSVEVAERALDLVDLA